LHSPFQLLCVALSMDTTESLALVEDSMVAIRAVQQYFPTKRVQRAVRMAEYLVRMCQRNKLGAAETLSRNTQGILESREYLVSSPGNLKGTLEHLSRTLQPERALLQCKGMKLIFQLHLVKLIG
jgi:hypothetical protein